LSAFWILVWARRCSSAIKKHTDDADRLWGLVGVSLGCFRTSQQLNEERWSPCCLCIVLITIARASAGIQSKTEKRASNEKANYKG
ncbi:hypothetical protein EDD22DRAFT_929973, partial [Suillus occidentalis]